jgi:disulfide bond formation protein DsbB
MHHATESTMSSDGAQNGEPGWQWQALALVVALVGVTGSVALSLALGLKACPLCFYQRSFAMGVLAVLAVGWAANRERPALNCLLSIPLAIAGLAIASFHEYLVLADVLECPLGLLEIGTAPAQSLALFLLLSAILVTGVLVGYRRQTLPTSSLIFAVLLGLLLAWASIASSPPAPPIPKAPYDPAKQPLEMCRPPYREAP